MVMLLRSTIATGMQHATAKAATRTPASRTASIGLANDDCIGVEICEIGGHFALGYLAHEHRVTRPFSPCRAVGSSTGTSATDMGAVKAHDDARVDRTEILQMLGANSTS